MLHEHTHVRSKRPPSGNIGDPETFSLRAIVVATLLAIGLAGLIHHAISGEGGWQALRNSTQTTVQP